MKKLKDSITTAPALAVIDYESGRMLYPFVDLSGKGGGYVLEQVDGDGKKHPIRFESTL